MKVHVSSWQTRVRYETPVAVLMCSLCTARAGAFSAMTFCRSALSSSRQRFSCSHCSSSICRFKA
ncbi:hypothetical protein [Streptomyces sp. NBC_01334]|uniref:hypothetical protein n=1 Tax=Streptomyces sp. NBC_01334 TaxID=2903827 RepID=UPI002E138374|nr:hypothetical protein OG736_46825 [Streptomyces sp. NBC_01334]